MPFAEACPPSAPPGYYYEPKCDPDDGDGVDPCFWSSVEYLLWWVKDGPLPVPLVTSGSDGSRGELGRPGTGVLFGGSELDYNSFSGGRFTLGLWHNNGHTIGFEASGFFLEERPNRFQAASAVNGSPLIARPVVNAVTGLETAQLVASPGEFTGSIVVKSTTSLYGCDVNALANLARGCNFYVDGLLGFRYLRLGEDIDVRQSSSLLAGGALAFTGATILPPGTVTIFDSFATRNQFYGGQVGARAEYSRGRVFVHVLGKVALGSTHQAGLINGTSTLSDTILPTLTVPGGVLALSSNIGRSVRDEFSVVPELGINVGYQFTCGLRAFVGYTFLYWSEVARPGDLINRTVNPTLLPTSQAFGLAAGPVQPISALRSTDYWAQGANLGLEFRW